MLINSVRILLIYLMLALSAANIQAFQQDTGASAPTQNTSALTNILKEKNRKQWERQLAEIGQRYPEKVISWLNDEKTSLLISFQGTRSKNYGHLVLVIEQIEMLNLTLDFTYEMNRLGWNVHYSFIPSNLSNNPASKAPTPTTQFFQLLSNTIEQIASDNPINVFVMAFDHSTLNFFALKDASSNSGQYLANLTPKISGLILLIEQLSPDDHLQLINSESYLASKASRIIISNKLFDSIETPLKRIIDEDNAQLDRFNDTFYSLNNATFTSQRLHGWMKNIVLEQSK